MQAIVNSVPPEISADLSLGDRNEDYEYSVLRGAEISGKVPDRIDRSMEFRKWRKSRGIKRCRGCGRRLTKDHHHTLCDNCWNEIHGGDV